MAEHLIRKAIKCCLLIGLYKGEAKREEGKVRSGLRRLASRLQPARKPLMCSVGAEGLLRTFGTFRFQREVTSDIKTHPSQLRNSTTPFSILDYLFLIVITVLP